MIYIDTSALLKLLWVEPESRAIREAVAVENRVLISSLAELESEVQLRAKRLAGGLSQAKYKKFRSALASFRDLDPFEFHDLPGTVFRKAIQQHAAKAKIHCRSLDRLHLAAMQELGSDRLLTNDLKQAAAAQAEGFEAVTPGLQ